MVSSSETLAEERRRQACVRARKWREQNRERDLAAKRAWYHAQPKKGRRSGEEHHLWKGDGVSYDALHRWVSRNKGKPSVCEHCGTEAAKKYEWANVDHTYRRELEDWLRLCTSCHRRYDYENGLSLKGGRRKGA